jgi:hypothetical protein
MQSGSNDRITINRLTSHELAIVLDGACSFVHLVQPWHLNQPSNIVREQLVIDHPFGELVPLLQVSDSEIAVSGNSRPKADRPTGHRYSVAIPHSDTCSVRDR